MQMHGESVTKVCLNDNIMYLNFYKVLANGIILCGKHIMPRNGQQIIMWRWIMDICGMTFLTTFIWRLSNHNSDVMRDLIASYITGVSIVCPIRRRKKKNIKTPRHWPLHGNLPVTGGFLSQRANNAEKVPFDDVIMHTRKGLIYWHGLHLQCQYCAQDIYYYCANTLVILPTCLWVLYKCYDFNRPGYDLY